jgi:hypothetical protein
MFKHFIVIVGGLMVLMAYYCYLEHQRLVLLKTWVSQQEQNNRILTGQLKEWQRRRSRVVMKLKPPPLPLEQEKVSDDNGGAMSQGARTILTPLSKRVTEKEIKPEVSCLKNEGRAVIIMEDGTQVVAPPPQNVIELAKMEEAECWQRVRGEPPQQSVTMLEWDINRQSGLK